jgi:hypothetical protein
MIPEIVIDLGITLLFILGIAIVLGGLVWLAAYDHERERRQAEIDAHRLLHVLRSCAKRDK